MTKLTYIINSFIHYLKANLLVASGVAISTMVLTGALITGDSVRYSLQQTVGYRLGETTHAVAAGGRYFRRVIAHEMEAARDDMKVAPVLLLEGVAVANGGQQRVNRVQVIGVNSSFYKISRSEIYSDLADNEVIVNRNLADKLQVEAGEDILVRVQKASLIPQNAPFVSAGETSVTLRARIKGIAEREDMGHFNLKSSQTAPCNLFMSLTRLNSLMQFKDRANHLLVTTSLDTEQVYALLDDCLAPADAGLETKFIESAGKVEIATERVFMEPRIAEVLEQLRGAQPVITYFVNGLSLERKTGSASIHDLPAEIPYSFISTVSEELGDDEIILTRWAADDLGAAPGDIIKVSYFEVGPLRQLIAREADFRLKQIVPMNSRWADSTLMPMIPGLSDAGHCREWDAGVPIDLDAIREKDEQYWSEWKGAPKAFVSLNKAKVLWENRFGRYTAVRYDDSLYNERLFRKRFAEGITPAALGMTVEPVRELGTEAARNGTDFSGLFVGLSFFMLFAAVMLTVLLFRLNIETRTAEIGTLSALGFRTLQIRQILLWECFVVALTGGFTGILLSVAYTSGIFRVLNTLWYEIVRTDVLLIKLNVSTLILGMAVSLCVSLGAIFFSVSGFLKKKITELQRKEEKRLKGRKTYLLNLVMWGTLIIPALLIVVQILRQDMQNPVIFFVSGGMLVAGILLACRYVIFNLNRRGEADLNMAQLPLLNLSRNSGRSLTIITLFALGTFLVISTGSYKLDLFAKARDSSSGTGGFEYFAQSTMPVLYDMNDNDNRAKEGIMGDFSVVQFRMADGDDASCLNLNRIIQPAILGVKPEAVNGRFTFATSITGNRNSEPWMLLDEQHEDGSVPAIADQTVIQWGLGKKIGDILFYQNEKGDTLRLKLVAGTTPSIFQGFVIISDNNFLENYPSSSGSQVFLIDCETDISEQVADELNMLYRDYGWEMEPAAKRLAMFYSVTNTYLSIFLALGALGMVLGTVGLAVILARSVLERRSEIALMQAVGFSRIRQFWLLSAEYIVLLVSGLFAGFIPAVVATLPSFISENTDASLGTVAIITAVILMNGFIWIMLLSWRALRYRNLVSGLRHD